MDLRNSKPPQSETGGNIVRGPWDQPPEKPAPRLKVPVWRRAPLRRGKGEPMVNNWGRLLLLLALLFLLPPVATWLVQRLVQLVSGQG